MYIMNKRNAIITRRGIHITCTNRAHNRKLIRTSYCMQWLRNYICSWVLHLRTRGDARVFLHAAFSARHRYTYITFNGTCVSTCDVYQWRDKIEIFLGRVYKYSKLFHVERTWTLRTITRYMCTYMYTQVHETNHASWPHANTAKRDNIDCSSHRHSADDQNRYFIFWFSFDFKLTRRLSSRHTI